MISVSYEQTQCCHGTFGRFRTQLGSGGNGREQSGKSRAMYAGRSLERRTVKEVGGEPAIAECYCTKLKCVCKQLIINKLLVEATGVELFSLLITRKLLIPGTATTAKKAPLPDPLYVYCTNMLSAFEFHRHHTATTVSHRSSGMDRKST
jgi:hypothetical protein